MLWQFIPPQKTFEAPGNPEKPGELTESTRRREGTTYHNNNCNSSSELPGNPHSLQCFVNILHHVYLQHAINTLISPQG